MELGQLLADRTEALQVAQQEAAEAVGGAQRAHEAAAKVISAQLESGEADLDVQRVQNEMQLLQQRMSVPQLLVPLGPNELFHLASSHRPHAPVWTYQYPNSTMLSLSHTASQIHRNVFEHSAPCPTGIWLNMNCPAPNRWCMVLLCVKAGAMYR